MTLEALLAYAHLLAILTMVVFLASEAALCRVEWLNAAVVERLGKIDMVYGISAGLVLLTGLARVFLGSKGAAWYAHNPLLYLKLAMFLVIGPDLHQADPDVCALAARAARQRRFTRCARDQKSAAAGDGAGAHPALHPAGGGIPGAGLRLKQPAHQPEGGAPHHQRHQQVHGAPHGR